jgi:hypothetical protein
MKKTAGLRKEGGKKRIRLEKVNSPSRKGKEKGKRAKHAQCNKSNSLDGGI